MNARCISGSHCVLRRQASPSGQAAFLELPAAARRAGIVAADVPRAAAGRPPRLVPDVARDVLARLWFCEAWENRSNPWARVYPKAFPRRQFLNRIAEQAVFALRLPQRRGRIIDPFP